MLALPHLPPSQLVPAAWVLLGLAVVGCDSTAGRDADRGEPAALAIQPIFEDATARVGLDQVHFNGMTGQRYIVEMMGPGRALFDYDGDGDLDLWVRQGKLLGEHKTFADALFPPSDPERVHDRLFRNDLTILSDGLRTLRFTDVSDTIGVRISDYGVGVAAGDYDADGDTDLYLTNFGPNRLLANQGDGTFRDVTAESGTGDDRWSVPAVFADLDGDGHLDLWVGNYVDFSLANHRTCVRPSSAIDYCGPLSFRAEPDRLFRNRGDGTFEDVTAVAGMSSRYGNSLGVLARDLTGDGKLDLFIANDAQNNLLWINRGDGTFFEDGLLRGVAVNNAGEREGNMGVTAGDIDGDLDADIFVSHMATEGHILFVQDEPGVFRDGTLAAGLKTPSLPFTGFGTSWIDLENDGILDLFVANGEVKVIDALEQAGDPYPLHQRNQLFRGRGDGTFEDITDAAGPAMRASHIGRGAAFGDVDDDGDADIVVFNNNGPTRLLLNAVGQDHPWVGFVLVDARGRAPQGARAELRLSTGARRVAWTGTDGSYASANDPRVLFGLGDGGGATEVQVDWPSGRREVFALEGIERYVRLVEGEGHAPEG
jgi:hypothetical protein